MLMIAEGNASTFEAELQALMSALIERYHNRAHALLRLTFDPASCVAELSYLEHDLDPLTKRVHITRETVAMVNPCTADEGFVLQVPAAPEGDEVRICTTLADTLVAVDQAVTAWHIARHALRMPVPCHG